MANRAFIRFPNVTIANGATPSTCYVALTAYESKTTTTVNLTLGFVDADDQAAPADKAALDALTMTTATVAWSPAAWVDGTVYFSPDLSASATEVFARAGWASGQALVLVIENNASDAGAYRAFATIEHVAGAQVPKLYIGV